MRKSLVEFAHPEYRPDIDGLRALAVISVVIYHAFPEVMPGGFIGVDVFFVISGYLISAIILGGLRSGQFSFSDFYARRVLRIFPALALVLFCSLVVGWLILVADELNQLGKHVLSGALFASNVVLWGESGYFDNAAETKPLLHLWSLGIEEQFYIVWPLLLWLAWKARANLLLVTVVLAVASFVLNVTGIQRDAVTAFFLPQARAWELLAGSVLAWILRPASPSPGPALPLAAAGAGSKGLGERIRAHAAARNLASGLGCVLLACGFWSIDKATPFPGWWALWPVLGTCLVVLAGANAWVNRNILSHRILVWFGLISFPLYLWHWPLLSFARITENQTPSPAIQWFCVLLSVALAWATVQWLEKPFRSRRPQTQRRLLVLVGAMAVNALLGLWVFKADWSTSHGYENALIERKGFEHAFGPSLQWVRGKDDWLFLGNAHDNTVAKLRGAVQPSAQQIEDVRAQFEKMSSAAAGSGTHIALFVGPNKSSIYPEFLPSGLQPAQRRYIDGFLEALRGIPHLTVYDPSAALLHAKTPEETVYFRADSHWNQKGAYIAYAGLLKELGIAVPRVHFRAGGETSNDLIRLSKLKDFPLHKGDNFEFSLEDTPKIREVSVSGLARDPFGTAGFLVNEAPLSEKVVWVWGDSFSAAVRPYLNATFREVHYIGHWSHMRREFAQTLAGAEKKPDLVIVIQVERSF